MKMLTKSIPVILLGMAAAIPAHAKGKHSLTLGLDVEKSQVKNDGKKFLKGKRLYGAEAGYRFQGTPRLVYALEGRYVAGKLKNEKSGANKRKVDSKLFEVRPLVHGVFKPFDAMTLEPFTGVGYRQAHTKSKKGLKQKQDSKHWYIPVGARMTVALGKGWSMAAKGEYDYVFNGHTRLKSKNSSKIKYKQNKGNGYKAELMLNCDMGHFDLGFGPYFHQLNLKKSSKKKGTYVNKSRTTETGAAVRVTF